MPPANTLPRSAPFLQKAMQCLQTEDYAGAETILNQLLRDDANDPNALHLLGLVRLQQHHHEEAAPLMQRSIEINPRHYLTHLNLAKVLVLLGKDDDAIESFRAAIALKPEITEAHLELGNALHRVHKLEDAEKSLRVALKQAPDNVLAKMALGGVLVEVGRYAEAEPVLAEGVTQTDDEELKSKFYHNLGLAQTGQGKDAEALDAYEKAQEIAPYLVALDAMRAGALQKLHRHDEALATLEMMLEREPQNLDTHYQYNSLLYRVGRDEEFLTSFDRAAKSPQILAAKGTMNIKANRGAAAVEAFSDLIAIAPDDAEAYVGLALSQSIEKNYDAALAAINKAVAFNPDEPRYLGHKAGVLIRMGDAQQAEACAARSHDLDPLDQTAIALRGTAWRMMQDKRDEDLNGYDGPLIRTFQLEPPKGWSCIEAFNEELSGFLDQTHPDTREYFDQSLRNGTQTPDNIFGAGHALVEALRERIVEAVGRYVRELPKDSSHPLTRRKTDGFRFAGSWSSRLRDCGYHVNHVHPSGWISSCYYIALPEAVKDEEKKEGWINFGQSSVKPEVGVRRSVQPVSGRLILFPSFTWHGTNPFHEAAARTTIAFDVVPD